MLSMLEAYTKNKLKARSVDCIFLGYDAKQSGYICYDMKLKGSI